MFLDCHLEVSCGRNVTPRPMSLQPSSFHVKCLRNGRQRRSKVKVLDSSTKPIQMLIFFYVCCSRPSFDGYSVSLYTHYHNFQPDMFWCFCVCVLYNIWQLPLPAECILSDATQLVTSAQIYSTKGPCLSRDSLLCYMLHVIQLTSMQARTYIYT